MDMSKSVSEFEARDSYWANIIAKSTPGEIATLMLADAQRIDDGYAASPLAMHLPKPTTPLAMEIASHLTPVSDLDSELKQFLYGKMRSRLREANEGGDSFKEPPLPDDDYLLASEMDPELESLGKVRRVDRYIPPEEKNKHFKDTATVITGVPTAAEIDDALKVLDYLTSAMELAPESLAQVQGARAIITEHLVANNASSTPGQQDLESQPPKGELTTISGPWNDHVAKYHIFRPPKRQQGCYICRFHLKDPHPVYKSMCGPCGAFNYAGNSISLPSSLKLPGKIALVTGARVNLGYRTALRLLRCGAKVIATTRYPNDAAVRYSQEPDFEEWQDRLKIIGADFRTARDAFGLVKATQIALAEWGVERLHILINNAAQTLTDSIKKEERAIVRETQQSKEASSTKLVQQTHYYSPRVRGGITPLALYGGDNQLPKSAPLLKDSTSSSSSPPEISVPGNVKDDGRTSLTEIEPYFKSSWVQSVSEIPYEDIISAHAVNAFVPLILCRELLPLMGELKSNRPPPPPTPQSTTSSRKATNRTNHIPPKPLAYILNISSREGLFESTPSHSHKKGHHVHTNMTKAAINMIVQTEAQTCWEERLVSMNTVDPGYMSSAPEMDHLFGAQRPLDWEDGVARVLWVVAVGEGEGQAVWGRFLKHFGGVGGRTF
ncbi:3-oxoacyl-reductase 4 [Rhypophila sp. PSN 637]